MNYDNPVAAADAIADYVNTHVSAFPERLKNLALAAVREASPVVRLVKGMEVLFTAAQNEELEGREEPLGILQGVCLQIAEGNFWGKQDRALAVHKWTRLELGQWPEGMDPPAMPELDPEYAGYADPVPPGPDIVLPG